MGVAKIDARELCAMVDHTLLKPEATQGDIEQLCAEAERLHTRTVCVNGLWVRMAAQQLGNTDVDVCAVIGFPLGAMYLKSLLAEAADAIEGGAAEIDMVIPLGYVKSGAWAEAKRHISAVRSQLPARATLKVILETALLSDAEIVDACSVSIDAGAEFVKTSTGFGSAGGATVHAVQLMRKTVGPNAGVKAAGGIRTLRDALDMVNAGANRLGLSATTDVAAELTR
jgi:deoxyribose-phosphate aldolase